MEHSNTTMQMRCAQPDDEDLRIRAALNATRNWRSAMDCIDGVRLPPAPQPTQQTGAPHRPERREYVCHRCKRPGHLMKACPTRGDQAFDKKIVHTNAGMPLSHFKIVSAEEAIGRKDVFHLKDGTLGLFCGDRSRHNALDKLKAYASQTTRPSHLVCKLCNNVLRDAMKIKNCCPQSFCRQCMEPDCDESTIYCPQCKRKHSVLSIVVDDEARAQVSIYLSEKR